MKKLWILYLILIISNGARAYTQQQADAEYAKGNYQEAIREYEALLKEGVSAELYYNLGNAYFRTDEVTRAIINYERALKLAPSDADIQFNLQFARARTEDRLTPAADAFFVTWWRTAVNALSARGWARLSMAMVPIMLVMLALYFFAREEWLARGACYVAIASGALWLIAMMMAWLQHRMVTTHDTAVITAPQATVRKTPDLAHGEEAMVLHEGTSVRITDGSMADWREVSLTDGRSGWMLAKDLEEI